MDMKQYYRKMREVEAGIAEPYVLLVSVETTDGGKADKVVEMSREYAARMIVDGRARIASEEERQLYREQQATARQEAEKAELAKRVQVAIISDADLKSSVSAKKPSSPGPATK